MPHNLDYTKVYKDTMWLQTTGSADNGRAETVCLRAFSKQQRVQSCGSVFKVSFITAPLQDNTCHFLFSGWT